MQITRKMKMADMIHLNYQLLPILNRFGIRLGFGEKTVEEICNEKNINIYFFLDIVNAYHDVEYFSEKELRQFPIKLLLDYLKSTHEFYRNIKIPELENCIDKIVNNVELNQRSKVVLVKNFFAEYQNELTDHIEKEESEVYPYVLEIEKAYLNNKIDIKVVELIQKKSIQQFADEHDNVEEKLFDLKNIIMKYLPESDDSNTLNKTLFELFRLEKDLNDHQRIEDQVMIPKILEMEKHILNQIK